MLVLGKTWKCAAELQRMVHFLALSVYLTNVSNPSSCYDALKSNAPKAVINAAAYTDVDKAETE